jgi:carotenoid cleavage dioxygenase-like enzyme
VYSELTAFFSISTAARLVYACAHPHEENDGNVYHMMTSIGRQTGYNIVQVPPVERANHIKTETPLEGAKIVATIKAAHRNSTYYHSFGITPNYFIFVENPFSIDGFEVLRMKIDQRSFHECMHWDSKEPSRYILERSGLTPATTLTGVVTGLVRI